MNFYYVNDKNDIITLDGTNDELYKKIRKELKADRSMTGVVGVIDDLGRLRSTIMFDSYQKNLVIVIRHLIRKYNAINVLEKLAATIKANA